MFGSYENNDFEESSPTILVKGILSSLSTTLF